MNPRKKTKPAPEEDDVDGDLGAAEDDEEEEEDAGAGDAAEGCAAEELPSNILFLSSSFL